VPNFVLIPKVSNYVFKLICMQMR